MSANTSDWDYEYTDGITHSYSEDTHVTQQSCTSVCVFLQILNTIFVVLGVCGNGLVIWIAGFKTMKTVNTTWYLSLAISDFVFCLFIPFNIAYMATKNWVFGLFTCKFISFIMFLNMFSSIFLLAIISIDRCVSVIFPVWAQNHRTVKKAIIVVTLSWIGSIVITIPSAIFRKTKQNLKKTVCSNGYKSFYEFASVTISRSICGFFVPFLVIVFCYAVITWEIKTKRANMSSKPFKVMSALIGAFFICWLPYHISSLMEVYFKKDEILSTFIIFSTTLANANSVLNPFLYAFMGAEFKEKFWKALLSKIESAFGEETHTQPEGRVSLSTNKEYEEIVP